MLSKKENELLTQTGAGTPMGELFRRYWIPAVLSEARPITRIGTWLRSQKSYPSQYRLSNASRRV